MRWDVRQLIRDWLSHARTPLFRNAYALMVNQGLNAALGVGFWIACARLFSPGDVGRNAGLLSTMAFIALVSQLGLRNAMAWVLPTAGSSRRRFVVRAYVISTVVTCAAAPAMLIVFDATDPAANLLDGGVVFAVAFTASAMLSSIFNLQDGVLVGLRHATWVPVENAAFGIVKIALLPAFAMLPAWGIFGAWVAALVPVVVAVNVLIFWRLLSPSSSDAPDRAGSGRARFIAGDYVGTLLIQGTMRLIPLIVIGLLGAAANAYSFQAWTVAMPMFLVAGSMMSSLTVESLTSPDRALLYSRRMLVSIGRLLVPASAVLAIGAPLVLQLFGTAYAREASDLLRVLAVSTVPITLNVWYYAICRIRGTVAPIVATQAVVAALTIGFSVLLLPQIGISGTGVAWLIGQSVAAAIVLTREFRWTPQGGIRWPVGGLGQADQDR